MSRRRENSLLRLVHVLWNMLDPGQQAELSYFVEKEEMGWAIPIHRSLTADTRLTTRELADELGVAEATIRTWAHRYGLKQVNHQYRWGDVKDLESRRNRGDMPRAS